MPKVSIIVPVCNVEKYVSECLDSLLTQTLQDIEIICIDDGSTDSSSFILDEYSKRDSRMRVYHQDNHGYGYTVNRGIDLAKSSYVGIIESDDYASQAMFEDLYYAITANDLDVVKSNFYKVNEGNKKGIKLNRVFDDFGYNKIETPLDKPEIIMANVCIWSALYKKEFLEQSHIRLRETSGAAFQDSSFTFQVLLNAKRIMYLENGYVYYRMDNMQSSVHSPYKVFNINSEYQYMTEYAEKSMSDKKEEILELLQLRRYRDYKATLFKLAPAFRYAYVIRMAEEYRELDKRRYLNQELWKEKEWKDIHEIMMDEHTYFMNLFPQIQEPRIKYFKEAQKNMIRKGLLHELSKEQQLIIYGAGIRGRKLLAYFRTEMKNVPEIVFAVTNQPEKKKIDGVPVYKLEELGQINRESTVLVAVADEHIMLEMLIYAKELDFARIVPIDNDICSLLEWLGV